MSKRFSWIVPHQLAVGPFPKSEHQITHLSRSGITAVLCLTEKDELEVPEAVFNRFVWERVPIPDGFTGGVPTTAQFAQALSILSRWHRKGHVVYVHCLAGVGRSPSVCAAYLVQTQGLQLEESIQLVKERHCLAEPDEAQIAVMRQFFEQQGMLNPSP